MVNNNQSLASLEIPLVRISFGRLLVAVVLALVCASGEAASLEGILMPGPVSNAHAAFESNCEACHSPLTETKQQTLCLSCHTEVATDIRATSGFHGKHPAVAQDQCQSCHREHKGRAATTLAFDLAGFNHTNTDFPLHWGHAAAPCSACHQNDEGSSNANNKEADFKYTDAPTQCNACHAKDDTHQGMLGTDCASCHTVRQWQPAPFDHSTTAFPLTGSHAATACTDCHTTGSLINTPTQCASCHKQDDIHNGTLGSNCQQCHTADNWQKNQFNHQLQTGFALTAGHAGLACISCHTPGLPMSSAQGDNCLSCHAKDDVHQGNNGTACQSCHTTAAWRTTTFKHAAETGFALQGAHTSLTCNQCHKGALTDPIGNTCDQCHSPDPHAGQLGNNCQQCHNESQWSEDLTFSHELTSFPLLGMHSQLACPACHTTARFLDAKTPCVNCHQQDDVHKQGMGQQCGSCHNPASWQVQRFDHAQISGFALIGEHANLSCAACHQDESHMRANGPDECSSCHRQDDPHQSRFGTDCVQCHNNQSFREIKRL